MKSTGIVRRIDSFGRVVLPMELRKLMDLHQDTAVELFVDGENIILHKYNPACIFCGSFNGAKLFEQPWQTVLTVYILAVTRCVLCDDDYLFYAVFCHLTRLGKNVID